MKSVLLICLLLVPVITQAGLSFEQLEQLSRSPSTLNGHFNQTKYLSALDVTLSSSGVFSYQRGSAIRWETRQPIQNTLLMTPASIINRQGEQELMRLEMEENPAARVLGEIFFAVLTAEWQTLAAYFVLEGELGDALEGEWEGTQWHAVLRPVDSSVLQVVSRVDLVGDDLLREVVLHEQGGNRTTIRFDSLQP